MSVVQVDSEIREKENEIQKKRPAFIKAKEKTSHMQKKVDGAKKSLSQATKAHKSHVTDVQELESEQWSLQEDYGRLMLEQTTWSSHHRVEKVARAELGMRSPDFLKYRVVVQ